MGKKPATPAMYVTADEAVARLINIQFVPTGYSLLELTSAFLEQVDVDIANTPVSARHGPAFTSLRRKYAIFSQRHELAKTLIEALYTELASENTHIQSHKNSVVTMLDWDSVRSWADAEFEISVAGQTSEVAVHVGHGNHPKYSEKLRGLIGSKGYSQLKTVNLLASFYVLLFEFAKKKPKIYFKHDAQLSIDPLAEELALVVSKDHPMFESYGQSKAAWKLQIQTAREVLRSASDDWPGNDKSDF